MNLLHRMNKRKLLQKTAALLLVCLIPVAMPVSALEDQNSSFPEETPLSSQMEETSEASSEGNLPESELSQEPSSSEEPVEESSLPEEGEETLENEAETFQASELLVTGGHKAYMHGESGRKFRPDANMTRAEVAQMLYNLLAAKPAVSSSVFSDVSLSSWYGVAVNTLAKLGALNGYADGTFDPEAPITRAEFVKVVALCFPMKTGDIPFPDVSEKHWARKYISSAIAYGWIGGYKDGTFRPDSPILRCEAAKLMNVALGRMDEDFAADAETQKFVDVPKSHWAYKHIAKAAEPVEGGPVDPSVNGDYVRVTATSGLNLRSGPDTSYDSLTVLPLGTVLTVLSTKAAPWIQVKTSGGTEGYVHQDYVQDYTPGAASNVSISASSAEVRQYKTLYLVGTVSPAGTAMEWKSSNESVATVSEGFVYAKAPGTATITYTDTLGKSKASCQVTVTSPEAVRVAYTEPNIVSAGASFDLMAVTDQTKSAVRFTVTGGGSGPWETSDYTTESQSAAGLPTNTVRLFKKSVKFNAPGTYTLRAYSKTGSGSYSTEYAEFTVLVISNYDVTTTTYDNRKASSEVIDIIAQFEGFLPTVYPDTLAGNIPTVGYGYVVSRNETFYNNVTKTEARALLADTIDSGWYASAVNSFRSSYNLKMSQCQFDALVSFVYNCGGGTLTESSGGEPEYGTARVLTNAVVPPSSFPVSGTVNINDSVVYQDTSAKSTKVGTIKLGSSLSVLGVKTNVGNNKEVWYQVESGKVKGWARAGDIRLSGDYTHDLAYVDAITFGNNLTQWNIAGGVHLVGLFDRRMAEARLFSYGDYAGCYRSDPGYDYNPGYTIPSWYN